MILSKASGRPERTGGANTGVVYRLVAPLPVRNEAIITVVEH